MFEWDFLTLHAKDPRKQQVSLPRLLIVTLNGPVSYHWLQNKLVTWYKLKVRESCFCNGANLNQNAWLLPGLRLEAVFYVSHKMFLRNMFPFGEDVRLKSSAETKGTNEEVSPHPC